MGLGVVLNPTSMMLTGLIAGITVLAILNAMAAVADREMAVLLLKRETKRLREEYERRIQEMRRGRIETVEIVTEEKNAA
ncbi:MAG: hypothetical protein SFZ24_07200 [Planctomycetota bacterium]|nr:hypothetical protein [Planctomycetota bacterium]